MASITVPKLAKMKKKGEKISMITAYDFISAKFAEAAEIDIILVGDSLGNTVQEFDNTLHVTMDESIYHTRIVAAACKHAMVIGDMPFGSYQVSKELAISNAVRYLKETNASAVKLEGGALVADTIKAMVRAQIPVQAHIGLTPQSVHMMGGYKIARQEEILLEDAQKVQDAGAMSLILEGIPGEIAAKITEMVEIPTIGIGAGVHCDGQVLVWHDMLGYNEDFVPKFVKQYANVAKIIREALVDFKKEVKAGTFPTDEHTYEMK